MSRTRRILGGISFGYFNMALVTLVGLWLTPFLLKQIGQNDYGLWLLAGQILTYLSLVDFGIVALLPRETAYATGRAGGVEKATELPQLIGKTLRLVCYQMPVLAVAAFIMWLTMPVAWLALRGPLAIIMIALLFLFPLRIFQALLEGLQEMTFLGKIQLYSWLISTTLTIILILSKVGLYALAISWIAAQVSIALACGYRLWKRYPGLLPTRLPSLPWVDARAYLSRGFWISLSQIARLLLSGTDLMIIGKLLSPVAVVPYVCTGKLINVLANQPQMLMHVASPALSELKTGGTRQQIFQACAALSQAMLILSGGIASVVLIVNQGFIGWWISPEQFGGRTLSMLLVLNVLLTHLNVIANYSIFCFGYERRLAIVALLDGIVTTVSTLLLVWFYGPIGAPIGSMIGTCFISLPLNLSVLARESSVTIFKLLAIWLPWLWRFLLIFIAATLISDRWRPNTFLQLALTGGLTGVAYLVIMLPLFSRSPLKEYLYPQIAPLKLKIYQFIRIGKTV